MILETAVIAILFALIKGGKFKNIGNIKFRFWYLIILGFFVQQVPEFLVNLGDGKYAEIVNDLNFLFIVMSYILIALPLLFNLKIKGIYYALIGTVFNAIVIVANNGMMPVIKNAIITTGYDKTVELGQKLDMMHFVADENTQIKLLSDFIPIPKPYPVPHVLSIGDVLLCIGLFLFIQYMFLKKDSDPQTAS